MLKPSPFVPRTACPETLRGTCPEFPTLWTLTPRHPWHDHYTADDFNKHFPFIVDLFIVMKSWKGNKPAVFATSENNVHIFSLDAVIRFEELVTKYYCQQIFNYFGCAALYSQPSFCLKSLVCEYLLLVLFSKILTISNRVDDIPSSDF